MINVIIADHQAIFRAGWPKELAVEDDLRIVGQPQTNGADALGCSLGLHQVIDNPD